MQTLKELRLSENQIRDIGTQYMAEALLSNTVKQYPFLDLFYFHLSFFTQTLTRLYLQRNEIGDAGAQYLAKALLKNTVR